jgi:hypothetical protein
MYRVPLEAVSRLEFYLTLLEEDGRESPFIDIFDYDESVIVFHDFESKSLAEHKKMCVQRINLLFRDVLIVCHHHLDWRLSRTFARECVKQHIYTAVDNVYI